MEIVAEDVQSASPVNASAIQTSLQDAESAFLSCLDSDESTGVIVLRIPIDQGGVSGETEIRPTTTYGTDEARSCIQRIVGTMRFPPQMDAGEVIATLSVRTRR
jgi:hypothetical protein